jgi:drug/metabolite transporter (DMT)-like permease
MLAAVFVFSCMDAVLKLLVEFYPPMQVSALRGYASLPFLLLPALFTGKLAELKPKRWHLLVVRGLLSLVIMGGFMYAVQVLSLADAYAIFLSAPLIITALSVPFLGESVGWRRWAAICVGMAGVLAMLRPTAAGLMTLGALGALISAIGYAFNAIMLRVLARTEKALAVVFWQFVIMSTLSTLIVVVVWDWVPLRFEHFGWLALLGLTGAIAARLMTEAFRLASPSVIAPFEYTALLWGVAIDWAFWNTLPGASVYFGGGIVIASGLYIIWRERRTMTPQLAPAPGGSSATAT